ncbi:Asp-tRNA(Asn)/Glu-tRNA(Gln) amidotransferase subunit GatB [Patescibacteria group bacterium]|nr:Asp-tRNA(Asn)/Glu-tRNA(Gln) amidotransferase subunit GatB [Patescibacteria group bacterium]
MAKQYYPVIGLEIHAELNTNSKMFCGCKNDPDETAPNKNICPICMAHPGTLPVANKTAIESVIKVGLALGSDIADFTEFDRKNYFYPDIPKGYQISQYKYPVVSGGVLNDVAITRIHIEEDTGLSKHDRGDFTLVDYNRAGVPLMELVTEPVIHSAKQAGDFGRELQLLLRTLGVSDANMEKGEMRLEPNISISPVEGVFGTKVEIKNINSFRAAEKAIEYELARMEALYEAGRESEIVQETRGWDEAKQITFSQRSKENANDYRYFPDPDLPKMKLHSMFDIDGLKTGLPELPWNKRTRFMNDFGLNADEADLFVINQDLAQYFESHIEHLGGDKAKIKLASNYIANDLRSSYETVPVELSVQIIEMVAGGDLTSRAAKDIYLAIAGGESVTSAKEYATTHGLLQQNNADSLKPIIEQVLSENQKIADDFKGGKEVALQALLGMVMKATKGSANPGLATEIIKDLLK